MSFISLLANEFNFESYFDNNPEIMLLINSKNGKIVKANKESSKFYGYSIQELQNMKIHEINTFTKQQVQNEINLAKSQNRNYFIFRHKMKNSDIKHVEVKSYPINYNNMKVLFSTVSEINSKNIQNNTLEHYNKNLEDQVDIKKEIVLEQEKTIRNILFFGFIAQFIVIIYLIRNIKEKNKTKVELLKGNKDLKNKENELRDIKNRYKLAIDGSNDGLWDWNVKTNEVYFSARWKSMLGYKEYEIEDNLDEWSKRVHPDDIEKAFLDVNKHFEGKSELYINEHRMKHKNGLWIWILDRGKVIKDKDGSPERMVGFHTDITEKKQYEERLNKLVKEKTKENIKQFNLLQQQNKHAAMGEMISAISHQWRQPLNTLGIRVQMIKEDSDDNLVDKKYIEEFISESMILINFMSKTIDNFSDFFRIDKKKTIFDIRNAVLETTNILIPQIEQYDIKVITNNDTFSVLGHKNEFQQVILNIVNNAKDAIIDKKRINGRIEILIYKLNDKEGVISIKDNAGEISPDIKKRIFEPYFTTKFEADGTGLGLYMSKLIIENNMDGEIYLNDEAGTNFIIILKVC